MGKSIIVIVLCIVASILFLLFTASYILSLSEGSRDGIYQNIVVELAGISASFLLALSIYRAIDNYQEKSSQKAVKILCEAYLTEFLHKVFLTAALTFPIRDRGDILTNIYSATQATKDNYVTIESLVLQIEALPYTTSGKDKSDLSIICYEKLERDFEYMSNIIGEYVRFTRAWPDLVAAIFRLSSTHKKLEQRVFAYSVPDIHDEFKNKRGIYMAFLELLKNAQHIYRTIVYM